MASGHGQRDLHVAAGGVGVGADLVGLRHQCLRGLAVQLGEGDLDLGGEPEAAGRQSAEGDVRDDLGVGRVGAWTSRRPA